MKKKSYSKESNIRVLPSAAKVPKVVMTISYSFNVFTFGLQVPWYSIEVKLISKYYSRYHNLHISILQLTS
jgi:hypothetical protein